MEVIQTNEYVIIDGVKILPPKGHNIRNCVIIDNKVYADGYEYTDSGWKRTFKAILHCI